MCFIPSLTRFFRVAFETNDSKKKGKHAKYFTATFSETHMMGLTFLPRKPPLAKVAPADIGS